MEIQRISKDNNINKNMRNKSLYFLLAAALLMGVASCVDNDVNDDGDAGYYSATKKTAAELLAEHPETYSMYIELLQRAKPTLPGGDNVSDYFSMLGSYGTYTVFAPDNDAMKMYLAENGYESIQNIPEKTCDTIVRNHIVDDGAYFTTDYSDGTLPSMNMDDRYVVISSDSDVNNNNALLLYVNKRSLIVQKDDSVTNGVVHTINRVMIASNQFLPDLMEEDSTISIFCQALKLTHMADSLTKFIDYTYSVGIDSVYPNNAVRGIRFGGRDNDTYYAEKRYFKYTAFVEPNKVLEKKGIRSLDDLIAHAKSVYDATFPSDAGLYDNDYTNRKNPLNRWVSYHLMNRLGNYSDWAPYGEILETCCRTEIADAEDFWQTMLFEGMVRFCRAAGNLYANRKGLGRGASIKGARVLTDSESGKSNQQALNGRYFYLDDLMEYSTTVRDKVLNCRMRIDATTLSADFMNQGSRGHFYGDRNDALFGHKRGYIEGWKISAESFVAVHCDNPTWSSYLGNAVCVKGRYDVQIRLPNPPPGLYEIRMGYVAGEERGVVQIYFNDEPCGIPVDLTKGGWTFEQDFGIKIDVKNHQDDEEYNRALDKSLRNIGFMLAMDSYRKGTGATSFRVDAPEHLRRILTRQQFTLGKENWLRFRQVVDGDLEWSFDYIELCPKSVYASAAGEDRH